MQKRCREVEGSDDDSEPTRLSLSQKMKLVDHFRQFIQETGMQKAVPVFKQVEGMVYSEASTSNVP